MNVHVLPRMTVEEFYLWCDRQEQGRFELERGRVVVQQSQTLGHVEAKQRLFDLLREAIVEADEPLYALPDGPSVRIDADTTYGPDALVAALPKPGDMSLEIPDPLIVAEVLSPTSRRRDLVVKRKRYFEVPSLRHYLVVDPLERVVLHFAGPDGRARRVATGSLVLEPPGVGLDVTRLLAVG